MKKTIAVLLLIVILACSLCSCKVNKSKPWQAVIDKLSEENIAGAMGLELLEYRGDQRNLSPEEMTVYDFDEHYRSFETSRTHLENGMQSLSVMNRSYPVEWLEFLDDETVGVMYKFNDETMGQTFLFITFKYSFLTSEIMEWNFLHFYCLVKDPQNIPPSSVLADIQIGSTLESAAGILPELLFFVQPSRVRISEYFAFSDGMMKLEYEDYRYDPELTYEEIKALGNDRTLDMYVLKEMTFYPYDDPETNSVYRELGQLIERFPKS